MLHLRKINALFGALGEGAEGVGLQLREVHLSLLDVIPFPIVTHVLEDVHVFLHEWTQQRTIQVLAPLEDHHLVLVHKFVQHSPG